MTKYFILLVALLVCSACDQVADVFQDRKTDENRVEIKQYLSANKITADSTRSGMFFYFQKQNNAGQKPQVGDEVTVQFVARRFDGVIVDSSSSAQPTVFIRVPGGNTSAYQFAAVPALEELMQTGVEKLHEGDQLTLLVPWSLRTSVSASLRAPLYIPLRYDLKIVKVRTEDEQMDEYVVQKGLSVTEKTTEGLRFVRTLGQRDSTQIAVGNEVKVTYTGRLASNGYQFDAGSIDVTVVDPTGTNRGGSVVKGFNDGIAKMRFGEKATILFPSALGYTTTGSGNKIPAYAPLVFDIEVKRK